ncbi:beta-ketoacyl synthase N-terminal-like domain-containing protein [Herpetosiphon gulosus]|uniref:Acetyl-CoA acetyltransferase n=1 Tax=Herpetosiphon gulosus TaxID=1973496 RepID=A0ABP9WT79_9CHLR
MHQVFIAGTACTAVREHYDRSLLDLALEALHGAVGTLDPTLIQALYVGNALGDTLSEQSQLGAYIAGAAGLNCEAVRVEAAGASGALALRQGYLAITSGQADVVVVLGVEKATDKLDAALQAALALGLDGELERALGLTLTGAWALLMQRYLHEYQLPATAFAPFAVNAHANGAGNRHALYRFAINTQKWANAGQIAEPLNMLDCSTVADGAAAVVLVSQRYAREVAQPIAIVGSATSSTNVALAQRPDLLWLETAAASGNNALQQAKLKRDAINIIELSDPHGIAAALSLEALGYAERGHATQLAAEGVIAKMGALPLATAGGYKARGDVGGATGIYQVVELVAQLRGQAGANQVANAKTALAQCLGGVGATAVTHILQVAEV